MAAAGRPRYALLGAPRARPAATLTPLAGTQAQAGPARLQSAQHRSEHRVAAEVIVVVQVLVAERDAEHGLADQGTDIMNDTTSHAPVGEADGEPVHPVDRPSAVPSSSAPASEVIAPPTKSANRSWRSRRAKNMDSGLHCVCIGGVALSVCLHSHFRLFQTPMHLLS